MGTDTLSQKPDISVYYCFARSGGTLINRCLGCIPGNLVLSEVNPLASMLPVASQAHDWLQLVADCELEEFSLMTYPEQIGTLSERAQSAGRRLIIRDWPTLNFLEGTHWQHFFPSCVLEQELYLDRNGLRRRSAVVVRRAAAVYESVTRSFRHLKDVTIEQFATAYLAYAKEVSRFPIFQFEKFCADPVPELRNLCEALDCRFSESFLASFSRFDRCTGDNTLAAASRAASSDRIVPVPERKDSEAWVLAESNTACREADRLFGYES